MTLGEAYRKGTEILKAAGNEAPATDAGVLLCYAAGCDRTHLYAYGGSVIEGDLYDRYLSLLERRSSGVPLQYLTGVQEFMSLPFEVKPGVLIPRQDTELLAETVMKACREYEGEVRILDVGTGSGCIAVSLAYYIKHCSVTAVDKMPAALAVARRNAQVNGVADRIVFVESDLFDSVSDERFDMIVSNPPYIRTIDINSLQREVRCHEPVEALDGGGDGLYFYRSIIERAPVFLKAGGLLAFETGYDQASDVASLMSEYFSEIKIYKDLAGIDRVVTGKCC